ncbi:group II truncated hemoglobin [Parathalassolituus penaei]|uniref:Group II truncated hemoglobin n=1 Tax=Parathalassolituus penaei TaxID=2997323 RepID=A0A9X3ITV4_9GAMM|nr:group II truncated hemoglobin [Parathalassolituus penaei]MCY0966710.1 group II truncated hemoglobin [Parathalassolituus penaei]
MNTQLSPRPVYGEGDASYQAAGGYDGLKRLVDDFYRMMQTLPEAKGILAMHNVEDMTLIHDKLTRFLCGWLGGPKLFGERYGPIVIPAFHRQFPIGPAERDAWLLCMREAAALQPWEPEFRDYLLKALFVPAERSRSLD